MGLGEARVESFGELLGVTAVQHSGYKGCVEGQGES